MPRLRDATSVTCSVEETEARLERFLGSLRDKDGVSRLRLRVPTDGPTQGLSIDRQVHVEARRARDADNLNDVIAITWMPEGTAVFPTFEGTLVTWGEQNANLSYIELDGSYTPPFGAAGQLFDAAIGQRIAQTTAREFLRDLKDAIERG
jgi:hypothetical protein